ncbi:MAG: hypothetical protein ABID38_03440 [Candidatus Diapherotrites archaeon]
MGKDLVGKILHYYDKIGVAVIELSGNLKDGDKISIEKDGDALEQTVGSMQIEHEKIKSAKKGQAIGMKVSSPVKQNSEVFKVTE